MQKEFTLKNNLGILPYAVALSCFRVLLGAKGAVFALLVTDVLKVYETIYLPRSVRPKTRLP